MSTLAEYNNNPGNIRPPKGVTYDGQIGVDDNGFAVFQDRNSGQQALVNDVKHKLDSGLNTPESFIDRYTPASKENSEDSRDNYKLHLVHQLGLNSTNDPFPENSHEKIAQAIASFEGGTWKNPEPSQEEPKVPASAKPIVQSFDSSNAPKGLIQNWPYALTGGVVGAGISTAAETAKKLKPVIENFLERRSDPAAWAVKPQERDSLQRYLNSQINDNLRMTVSDLENLTGQKIRSPSEVQDALVKIKATPPTREPVVRSVDPTTRQPRKIFRFTPNNPGIDLSQFEHTPTFLSNLADEASAAKNLVKAAIPSVARVGVGALGGGLSALQLKDAFDQYQREGGGWHIPSGRNAAQFASGAGGALSTLPFGLTQVAGAALQAPELAYNIKDYTNKLREQRKIDPTAQGGLPDDTLLVGP